MKLIYDSGPLNVIENIVALIGNLNNKKELDFVRMRITRPCKKEELDRISEETGLEIPLELAGTFLNEGSIVEIAWSLLESDIEELNSSLPVMGSLHLNSNDIVSLHKRLRFIIENDSTSEWNEMMPFMWLVDGTALAVSCKTQNVFHLFPIESEAVDFGLTFGAFIQAWARVGFLDIYQANSIEAFATTFNTSDQKLRNKIANWLGSS